MGLATLLGMGGLGAVVIYFFIAPDLKSYFLSGAPIYLQLVIGSVYGILSAFLAWQLINSPKLKRIKAEYIGFLSSLKLSLGEILFISFCAGVGEELLFRGAVQPYLGIFFTSVVFVAVHGYLNPKNPDIVWYGIFMTLVIIGIGNMYEKIGVFSAMSAHFWIDVILLLYINFQNNN
ncbi:MAG: CPBP family intramembrane metalloprotease, partial [Bacteroidetes bacterium]